MKKLRIGFIGIFFLILVVFFINTVTSNKEISDVEKRVLATFPDIKDIGNEDFFDNVTSAFSDQLYGRDELIKWYYLFQFQRYLGDVVEGKDGEMFSSVQTPYDIDLYTDEMLVAIDDVNEIADELDSYGVKFIFLNIPRKDAYLEEYLPNTYTSSRERYSYGVNLIRENVSDKVIVMDALEIFENNKSDNHYYYKTDHHINVRGGYLLYKELMNYMDVTPYDLDDMFDIETVTVNGSFNKQVGQSVPLAKEELCLTLKQDLEYTRYDNGWEDNIPIWGKGHDYATAYMTGDIGLTIIDTNRDELPNVMYVGSSYTNVLEALTVPSVNRMMSIDYRDNHTGTSIVDYAKEYDIDYVVFIPAQSNNSLNPDKIIEHLGK